MAKRDIQSVPTEELTADLQQVDGATRRRIEEELKRRETAAPAQPSPQPLPGQAPQPPGFGANAWESLKQYGMDTAQGLQDMAYFTGNLFVNPAQAERQARGYLDAFSNIGGYLGDRYGSGEALANTAYTDPVGMLADAGALGAAVMTGGKAIGPLAAKAGTIPRVVSKSVEQGGRALSNLDPITGVATGLQAAAAPSNVARFIGDEYSKGSDVKSTPALENQIQGMLDEGFTPDVEGRNRWADKTSQAGEAVAAETELADLAIQSGAIPSPFTYDNLAAKLRNAQPEVTASRQEWNAGVDDILARFESELNRLGTGSMSVEQMRSFRADLDEMITDAARQGGGTAVNPKVKNALANAVRDLINTSFPDLGAANAEFSRLKGMEKTMEKTGMSDITDFNRVELSANMVVDAAKRIGAGESKVARAAGYNALRQGRYQDYLFDHSGAKAIMTIPRQQGAYEERYRRTVPYRVGILED